jgi:hypothetical protein
MAKKAKTSYPTYDRDAVARAANGNWFQILQQLGGVDADLLDGKEHPCPKCKGNTRFRFTDLGGDGSTHCGTCPDGKCGNGFDALIFLTGKKFVEVLAMVAEHLGIDPVHHGNGSAPAKKKSRLEFVPWCELLVATQFCLAKKPITPAAILAIGGRLARYHTPGDTYNVIAIPVWGELLDSPNAATGLPTEPVGWCMYNATGFAGGLPRFEKNDAGKMVVSEWVKVKLFPDSDAGWMGPASQIRSASTVWKLEGPSDLLAFYSLPDIPEGVVAISNFAGAREKPKQWMLEMLAGKVVNVLHDADTAGEEGAVGVDKGGKRRPGWLEQISAHAKETNYVLLPYEVVADHGKDLRDFLGEAKDGGD